MNWWQVFHQFHQLWWGTGHFAAIVKHPIKFLMSQFDWFHKYFIYFSNSSIPNSERLVLLRKEVVSIPFGRRTVPRAKKIETTIFPIISEDLRRSLAPIFAWPGRDFPPLSNATKASETLFWRIFYNLNVPSHILHQLYDCVFDKFDDVWLFLVTIFYIYMSIHSACGLMSNHTLSVLFRLCDFQP